MKQVSFIIIIILITAFVSANSQMNIESEKIDPVSKNDSIKEVKGLVLDIKTKAVLPYANIYLINKNKGAITNEKGHFTFSISDLELADTLRFQYIGYQTRHIAVADLDTSGVIYLTEEIINLSELIVFGEVPDLKTIVKNILVYKDSNYRKINSKRQTFLRNREMADLTNFKLNYKKSNIEELDKETIQLIEEKTPDYVTSYTDFLGHYYSNKNKDDSIKQKLDPVRMVSLKEEYLEDLQQFETLFEGILAETKEDEYWKIRSGVFGTKINIEQDTVENKADSLIENKRRTSSFAWYINSLLSYSTLNDKDEWEFIHKPGKYKYSLAGGTRVNGEDVYIIDFEPSGGMYTGRMFIGMNTYALIRADYRYAPGQTGTNVHLLGVGYTEKQFVGSIYFEKSGDYYLLKYFSYRLGYEASIDRRLILMKKKNRWLFDKKIKEMKLGLDLEVNVEESVEMLIMDETEISKNQFDQFEQPEYLDIIYVDQFDDNLWRGFSIIEPIEQMKEYKKHEMNMTE